MTNLIDDPAYLGAKIDLRRRLHAQLSNDKGEHVVPYTQRYSSGLVLRDKDGAKAAEFPPQWLTTPNRPDRMNGVYPDSPEKAAADRAGQAYQWRPSAPR
jgi:hypothetical protein